MTLDTQDAATILAALRYYQAAGMGDPAMRSDDIHDIATDGGNVISMDAAGIDDLCDRINTTDPLRDAAPDMLVALKSLVDVWRPYWPMDDTDKADFEAALRAIAKAEGRANG